VAAELPPDWQERMVEMIRGAASLDDAWFAGGPVCTPLQQIGIYRRQYELRLYDALVEEIPGLAHLLGDQGEDLLRRYLLEEPSRSWTLNRVADALPGWLQRQGVARHLVEMAHLDRAVQKGFEAAPGAPLDPASLITMPALRLQPHVSLLRLTHNVHEIRSAALLDREPPALRAGDYPIVVFRRGIKMRHWVMPLGAWGILDALADGLSVADALERVFTRGLASPEELAAEVGTWFQDFAERDLVETSS
jgi:hypothetical protein